ncbi:MAG: bifunctional methylenetetrahydrofolate dehydrogenase/methenyltetrahydrofolate cyclohydrolase FolD [Terriglobales bacterium]
MSAQLLDGTAIAAAIRAEVGRDLAALAAQGVHPRLAVVLVGHDPASEVYVRNKVRACGELGIGSERLLPSAHSTTEELLAIVERLNADPEVDGILVQLPLPPQVDAQRVLLAVSPSKDVDGFHPVSMGNLVTGRPGLTPCTPTGVIEILKRSQIEIAGKEAVVVGRSDIVGKPQALLLLRENATVTICHSRTRDLAAVCRRADILIAAIGRPALLGAEHIKPGAVVIDVGMNRLTDAAEVARYFPGDVGRREGLAKRGGTLIGDVDPRAAWERAAAFTPVPGGVGPLTIAMLMVNTVKAARNRRGLALAAELLAPGRVGRPC